MDTKELLIEIKKLEETQTRNEKLILNDLNSFKKYFDPVYHVKNVLPAEKSIYYKINNLLDDTIVDATNTLNQKIYVNSNDSFLLKAGGKLVTEKISKTVFSQKNKIKAISLAILKNILN